MSERKYFGTDGIRDRAGFGLLTSDLVAVYGRAFGRYASSRAQGGRVLIGRDTRSSGPGMVAALAEGLAGAGLDVRDGGVLTTPAVQTLCREEGFTLAIVVSASHNPAGDNGIKVFGSDGRKLPDEGEAEIESLIEGDRGPERARPGGGLREDPDAADRYVRFIRERCLPRLDLAGRTIMLDCAHGAASRIGPRLLDAFGARVFVHHAEPDGENINREAGVFHVERLRTAVLDAAPAVAVALDGDADRALFLDEEGALRDGDDVIGALAVDFKARGLLAGGRVVTTVMANFGLAVFLRRRGIEQETTAVGDRHVSARMAEIGATLGGEQSGHVIVREGDRWFGDGLYTALRLLEASCRAEKPVSELCRGIEKYPQLLINVPVKAKPPVADIAGLAAAAAAAEESLKGEGRVLLRYSGTESILRVMAEGRDGALVRRIVDELSALIRAEIGR